MYKELLLKEYFLEIISYLNNRIELPGSRIK